MVTRNLSLRGRNEPEAKATPARVLNASMKATRRPAQVKMPANVAQKPIAATKTTARRHYILPRWSATRRGSGNRNVVPVPGQRVSSLGMAEQSSPPPSTHRPTPKPLPCRKELFPTLKCAPTICESFARGASAARGGDGANANVSLPDAPRQRPVFAGQLFSTSSGTGLPSVAGRRQKLVAFFIFGATFRTAPQRDG